MIDITVTGIGTIKLQLASPNIYGGSKSTVNVKHLFVGRTLAVSQGVRLAEDVWRVLIIEKDGTYSGLCRMILRREEPFDIVKAMERVVIARGYEPFDKPYNSIELGELNSFIKLYLSISRT